MLEQRAQDAHDQDHSSTKQQLHQNNNDAIAPETTCGHPQKTVQHETTRSKRKKETPNTSEVGSLMQYMRNIPLFFNTQGLRK